MSRARLLQMSGVVVDLVYMLETVPRAGEDANASRSMVAGGGGFNAMIAAKNAGMEVAYGGPHGVGFFADFVRHELAKAGIPALQKQSRHGDQGSCVVLVDGDGERTFVSREGADGVVHADTLADIKPRAWDWILLSGYPLAHIGSRDMLCEWLETLPAGAKLVFDPGTAVRRIPDAVLADVISQADWLSANAAEAAFLSGAASPRAAAESLSARLKKPKRTDGGVVVRCGADGCWLSGARAEAVHIAGFRVDAIDTNGAGDVHIGAFVAALSNAVDQREAARYANAAAAMATTGLGPSNSPTDAEIRDFLLTQHQQ